MKQEQYEDIELWLKGYISYLPDADVSVRAGRDMKEASIGLADVYDVLAAGEVVAADREHDGCHFIVKGRNCDGREITIYGRFEAASLYVAIDHVI